MGEYRQRYNEAFKNRRADLFKNKQRRYAIWWKDSTSPKKSTLHQWMSQYWELKNEPAASVERVREIEPQLKEMSVVLQEGYSITERTLSVYMRQMKLRSIVCKPPTLHTILFGEVVCTWLA
ncbi:transposase [Paenibacillus etheri]|uniref:Uncharacterized protein n=1 Tax=Paenibacillus etheri TaxID=1306852 RepID=A0A0W1AVA6_9BACL|nr:transposase [Paenibacillus etheri]KTD85187.1 hypothetical protein UQ64_21340 [Paenibacillus etheri]